MYRTIDASFWTDSKVRKLAVADRLLFLYLITNPHTHVSGLYYLPDLIAQHETGLSAKQLQASKDTLSKNGIALFDPANELVWVVKMFRFQGSGMKNTLSAAHHISKDIHNSLLISEFLKAYPEVEPHVKNRVSIEYVAGATPDSPLPTPEPESGERRENKHARADARRVPFKDFMFAELRRVGVEPVTDVADWTQYERFLAKTDDNPAFTEEKLREYFTRFVNSPSEFHQRQGHPIRYFCANVNSFMREPTNGNGKHFGPASQNRRDPAYTPKQQ